MPSTPQALKVTPCRCRRAAAILLEMHKLPFSTGETELAEATGSAPPTVRTYLRLLEKLGLVMRRRYHYGHLLTPAGVQLVSGVTGSSSPESRWSRAIAAEIQAALAVAVPDGPLSLQGPPLDFADLAEKAHYQLLASPSNPAEFPAKNLVNIPTDNSVLNLVENPVKNLVENPANIPAGIPAENSLVNPWEKTPVLSTGYPQPNPQTVDKTIYFRNILENIPVQTTACCEPEIPESVNFEREMENLTLLSTGYPQPDPQTVDKTVKFLNKVSSFRFQSVKNARLEEDFDPRARESTTTAESLKDSLKDSFKDLKTLKTAAAEEQDVDARARANFAALQAYGVGPNARVRALCSREDLTPETIHAQAQRLQRQDRLSPPLLIHCLESRDPLDEPPGPFDCPRSAGHAPARPTPPEGPDRAASRLPTSQREREWARYTGGEAYAASWGPA